MLAHQLNRQAPEALVEYAHEHLNALLRDISEVEFTMLCSTDGFELSSASKKKIENAGKLAAVSSSILAMVQAFMGEINLEGCQSLTLDANNGKVVLTAIPNAKYPMVLVVLTSKHVLLGQLLYSIKKIVEAITKKTEIINHG
ncbi:roadblock/LC7 domain-containing protein [Acinetobacter cumulans]|uniref:Roadblock/LC7 domain-containing protein n=1 Tax=Acinetobacter cumulans TaxID=2136182 RepID=A0A498CTV0_9GAMM|nr:MULTISPECIES: roadblock/LC7 domain-containing protein [Acinetobacter]QCO22362.1 roadblock/LC7 domain-containing protein [Acinetobacter cumulans]RFS32241.1 roadblock/LC7 domain-containing protein [Acinetobacter sp. SWAC5]RKG46736.1 roadblock/LC7 domain-containing protein [Acinetobacter cumulans]RLL31621.1 roadblock/LC7 domain-containing protein [Acinetobacter cumulans]RZG62130.1 roadblock/LC7 domain-containing protein [Acinetobacter sp. WCHAc060006]